MTDQKPDYIWFDKHEDAWIGSPVPNVPDARIDYESDPAAVCPFPDCNALVRLQGYYNTPRPDVSSYRLHYVGEHLLPDRDHLEETGS